MALLNNSMKLMELRDAKIYKLLSDTPSATLAGTPTYSATGVDIPGVLKVKVTPKMDTKELKGDSVTIDSYSKITGFDIEIDNALFSLDAMPILIGGAVTDSGVTPNMKKTYSVGSQSAGTSYFKLMGKWTYVNDEISASNGDAHFILYKCKVTEAPALEINDASGNFGSVSLKAQAVACLSNGKWFEIEIHESASELA